MYKYDSFLNMELYIFTNDQGCMRINTYKYIQNKELTNVYRY